MHGAATESGDANETRIGEEKEEEKKEFLMRDLTGEGKEQLNRCPME